MTQKLRNLSSWKQVSTRARSEEIENETNIHPKNSAAALSKFKIANSDYGSYASLAHPHNKDHRRGYMIVVTCISSDREGKLRNLFIVVTYFAVHYEPNS